jgi:hypothetical protein
MWDEYAHLDPRVRVNLLRMAYDFYEKSKLPSPIVDIYLMGSIANYNWTPDSDSDVHVIIDYNKLKMPPETANKTVKTVSANWNLEHQVTVKSHKVEMNLQNVNELKPHVTGIYSLIKDKWVRVPTKQNVQVDKMAIQSKYSGMKKYIESAMSSQSRETMKSAKEYVDAFRQYGLDTNGELSVENIVFKILRSKGIIKQLKDSINATYDREMTVAEGNTSPDDYKNIHYLDQMQGAIDVKVQKGMELWKQSGLKVGDVLYTPSGTEVTIAGAGVRVDKKGEPIVYVTYYDKEGDEVKSSIYLNKLSYENPNVEEDYIGTTFDGELKATPVQNARSEIHNQHGMISGVNSENWRYIEKDNLVLWNTAPTLEDKERVNVFLSKRGFINPRHKNIYTFGEVKMSDVKSKLPLPSMPKDDQGNPEFSQMTLDNLKAMKNKSARAYDYYKNKSDVDGITNALRDYCKFNFEIKRRLKYINQSINESGDPDYNAAADFFERRDKQLADLADLLKRSGGKGIVRWDVVPAKLLKKTWLVFGKYHRVDSNDIDKISDQILTNIARLQASTEMMGHSNFDVRPELEDLGYTFTDEEWEDWMTNYFTNNDGYWLLSDSALPTLQELYSKIFNAENDEEKLYAIDKVLNVVHPRNDLASMFVEGGSATLQDVSNQGGYDSQNIDEIAFSDKLPSDNAPYIIIGFTNGDNKTISGIDTTGHLGHSMFRNFPTLIPVYLWWRYKSSNQTLYVAYENGIPTHMRHLKKNVLLVALKYLKDTYNIKPLHIEKKLDDYLDYGHRLNEKSLKTEGYGAANPEEDPLHIQGERWRIKFGSRKTPKMNDVTEMMNELVNETIEKLKNK